MKRERGFWHSLDVLPTGEAVLAEWRREMGGEFATGSEYLKGTGKGHDRHPCVSATPCGCQHRVVHLGGERFTAACSCPTADCPTFPVSREDVLLYRVDGESVGDAIRRSLGLEQPEVRLRDVLRAGWGCILGTLGPKRYPVVLLCCVEESELLAQLDELLEIQTGCGLIMTPTRRLHTEVVAGKLRRNACALMALSEFLVPEPDYQMRVVRSIEPVLDEVGRVPSPARRTERILKDIHQEIAAVRTEYGETRRAKERLEQMQAENLFKFVLKLDPKTFQVICAVLVHGDVAKASRALKMPDSTLREVLRTWETRGDAYLGALDIVKWRKGKKMKGPVTFNDAVLYDTSPDGNRESLLADLLDGLLSMTEANWPDVCGELTELLRQHLPR